MIRRWDLETIILDQQVSGRQTIVEKLEAYGTDVRYVIDSARIKRWCA